MLRRREPLLELIRGHREESRHEHEEAMGYLRQRDEEMREEFARRDEEFTRRDEEMRDELNRRDAEFKRLAEETREFNRELLLRNEKVYTAAIAQLEKNTVAVEESTATTRAQTQALLKLLDRFDDPGSFAAA